MELASLQERLGHRFADPALLRQALTHRSFGQPHNERLEFLGDSVLDCVIASVLYQRFREFDEGALSRLRSYLVRQQTLVGIAQGLRLGECLWLGEGEVRSGGAGRASILADTLEAVFGAIHLDAGFDAAQAVIAALYEPVLGSADLVTLGRDAKTLLQEWLQARKSALPEYSVVAVHGAAHDQRFDVECLLPALGVRVQGSGTSRRSAEQAAARLALDAAQAAVLAGQGRDERAAPLAAGR